MDISSLLTEDEFRNHIKKAADGYGSQKALADDMHVTPGYLSDILLGKRSISDTVAQFFGRKLVRIYVVPTDDRQPQPVGPETAIETARRGDE